MVWSGASKFCARPRRTIYLLTRLVSPELTALGGIANGAKPNQILTLSPDTIYFGRVYGTEKSFFEKAWKLPDVEPVS